MFPNLAFLEVDTDGLGTDADILRLALIDQSRRAAVAGCSSRAARVIPRSPISPASLRDASSRARAWPKPGRKK